jgi:hypothetical protein
MNLTVLLVIAVICAVGILTLTIERRRVEKANENAPKNFMLAAVVLSMVASVVLVAISVELEPEHTGPQRHAGS